MKNSSPDTRAKRWSDRLLLPIEGDLRVADYQLYHVYYCSVCKFIHHSLRPILSQLLLNNAVLMAILRSSVLRPAEKETKSVCIFHPLTSPQKSVLSEEIKYAAKAQLYLYHHYKSHFCSTDSINHDLHNMLTGISQTGKKQDPLSEAVDQKNG